jgi:DNA-binding winged helix-turn-helix (wHTH) protein
MTCDRFAPPVQGESDKLLLRFENYQLDGDRRELRRDGQLVESEPKVFDLLAYVVANRERVVSRDALIAAVWDGRIVSESALATCINAARAAVGDSGEQQRLIKTLPRRGIRFVGAVREDAKGGELAPTEPPDSARGPLALAGPALDRRAAVQQHQQRS